MTDTDMHPPPDASTLSGDAPIALITGSARRVGGAIADALAAAGCDVLITTRRASSEAGAITARVASRGRRAHVERLDLADLGAVTALGRRLAATLPRLDILIHNASAYDATPIAALDAAALERQHRINALAPLLLTGALAGRLRQSPLPGGGAVVCMCDIHAMGRPRAGFSGYAMSKAALAEMVQSLARDLAPEIRINGVAPGVVLWPDDGPEADAGLHAAYARRVPLGRIGRPEDAAEAVRWLALDARYTTGQIIKLDGGRSLA